MATILLSTAGAAIGSVFGPIGTLVGRAIGTLAGAAIDNAAISALTPATQQTGPRLTTTDITNSTEGSVIPRLYGRGRMGCQIFWATHFEEVIETETSGGKGGGSKVETTSYRYYANFAVGICEGPISTIGRIWFDGTEVDQQLITFRIYRGDEYHLVDSLMEAKEGSGNSPAYRGLAYVVFERLALEDYGNRIPQVHIEVFRSVGDLEPMIEGVAIIPGNEFLYEGEPITANDDEFGGYGDNRHTLVASTDWYASIGRLEWLVPSLKSVLFVVPWFGTDLRCGTCTIRPKVIDATRTTQPFAWQVAGLTRSTAMVVTQFDGASAYGGTPNDGSVIRAIQDLSSRGIAVTLLPFMMMDVPHGNGLPDPYGGSEQPGYPWRGRVTCTPAPGQPGTVDKTGAAGSQVATFVGSAAPGDFGLSGGNITYAGPAEWSYRRFILHYAKLAQAAGGVSNFLIGSEMIGLTQVRSGASTYPFVNALKTLASDVKGMLGGSVDVGYAADWSEYHSHRPSDGSNDVYFNLDPLWSDSNIDFIGIDNYMPLSDWRDGESHLDYLNGLATSIYDDAYLRGNVEGGELYDWYYASTAARNAQTRTPIVDGSPAAEHWLFRQKDVRNWWLNAHHNRPAGVRSGSATGWTPQSKPIVFTELGCGAVDKGANQPNLFLDAKSSESGWPYYSNHARDDAMQRAFLEALLGYWRDNNLSGMIDLARSNVWCWDIRPWPSFPEDQNIWGDSPNWDRGHWLNGRLGTAPARETIETILADYGFADGLVEAIPSVVEGVTVDTVGSARSILESIAPVHSFDAVESEGKIKFVRRLGRLSSVTIASGDLVAEQSEGPLWTETRGQETELPDAVKVTFGDPVRDDQPGSAEARRSTGGSLRTVTVDLPVIMPETRGRAASETLLHEAWISRDKLSFSLPPSFARLDPGDIFIFAATGNRRYRVTGVTDANGRRISAEAADPDHYAPVEMPRSAGPRAMQVSLIDPLAVFVDGPMLVSGDNDYVGYVGAVAAPFRSGIALYRSPTDSGFALDIVCGAPAIIGETRFGFYAGPTGRWDRAGSLYVKLIRGEMTSAQEDLVLNGSNVLLVQNQDGEWEALQFATATLDGVRSYVLSNLLRGQLGTEHAMRNPVPAGARVMIVNRAVVQPTMGPANTGLALNWRYGPADRAYSDPAYRDLAFSFTGKGRRPLSPVQFRGQRDPSSGDWGLRWIRRTRIEGDSWGTSEVPLGEASERYRVWVIDQGDGSIKRTVDVGSASWTYTAAMQSADFGTAQWSVLLRVAQISEAYGVGIASQELVWNREAAA